MSVSEIRKDNKGIPTLYVEDKPFFCYSGEVHNSSSSDLNYMKENIWPNLRELNMNSLIVPVYWEMIEEQEGIYDFSMVDGLIDQARSENMKLILLWFGLWKNSESMYVPGWMKKDTDTYYRVRKVNGDAINTISPLCSAAVEKDKAAFTELMKHLKEYDGETGTVIMIQVENEIGILGNARDYSTPAQKAFFASIPEEIAEEFELTGNWKEAFGDDAEEYFMAYYFAAAVERITEAGQKEYNLPCYVNAWLKQYPWIPGSYPSGGPVTDVHRIWKKVAPSLFTLAPDVYVPYCADVMDQYAYEGNPLFIPEIRKDAVAASYAMYAFTAKNAIGFSPFGIEEVALDPDKVDRPPMEVMIALNIDPSAFDIRGSKECLSQVYGLLKEMEPLTMEYRGTDHMKSYVKHSTTDFGTYFHFKEYDIQIGYSPKMDGKPLAAGMILELSDNKFLIAGMESTVIFRAKEGENKNVDFIKMEEGTIVNGKWNPGRILNGDEKMAVKLGDRAKVYMIELFKY